VARFLVAVQSQAPPVDGERIRRIAITVAPESANGPAA
jgi:hypothetical protein